jgi:hypothetical protein
MHVARADQVTVVMTSMGESVPGHVCGLQCRKSCKKALTRDFGQKSLSLRCGRPLRNTLSSNFGRAKQTQLGLPRQRLA